MGILQQLTTIEGRGPRPVSDKLAPMRILHISDLHYGFHGWREGSAAPAKGSWAESLVGSLCASVEAVQMKVDAVVVSGDITNPWLRACVALVPNHFAISRSRSRSNTPGARTRPSTALRAIHDAPAWSACLNMYGANRS
jgi:3',5'-cyclic AMP phosphodiesterase CpdA